MNQTISITKTQRIALFFAFLLTAVGLSLTFNISPAFAVGEEGTDPPVIDAGTGGGAGGGSGGGSGGGPVAPPKPSGGSEGWQVPEGVNKFQLNCQDWGGSGSWKISSTCNNSNEYIYDNAPGSPSRGWGYYSYRGIHSPVSGGTYVVGNTTCAPSGNKSAYAKNWTKQVVKSHERQFDFRLDSTKTEWIIFYPVNRVVGEHINMFAGSCEYPTTQWSTTTCFWNYQGDASYSLDRKKAFSSWSNFGTRSPRASDPKTPSGGTGSTAPNCGRTGSANVSYNLPVDDLGYYTVHVTYNYRTYTRETWVAQGRTLYTNWTRGGVLNGQNRTWWAYSCRPGSANALDGAYGNQSSIPDRDRYTNPATCPQVTWQCALDTPTTIGLDRTAVTSGRVSPTAAAKVMRNGEQVNVDFARVRVIDTSTSTDIDITNGGTAPSVRNISNIAYKTNVKEGSTPFYGDDPNASSQYFKMYETRGADKLAKFDTWKANNNSNLDKALSFNWASESSSERFAVQRTYRVTGEFYIPAGSTIGTGGAGASLGYKWEIGTYDCKDYSGRGSSRVDRGILTSTSNPVEVIRSVNR